MDSSRTASGVIRIFRKMRMGAQRLRRGYRIVSIEARDRVAELAIEPLPPPQGQKKTAGVQPAPAVSVFMFDPGRPGERPGSINAKDKNYSLFPLVSSSILRR